MWSLKFLQGSDCVGETHLKNCHASSGEIIWQGCGIEQEVEDSNGYAKWLLKVWMRSTANSRQSVGERCPVSSRSQGFRALRPHSAHPSIWTKGLTGDPCWPSLTCTQQATANTVGIRPDEPNRRFKSLENTKTWCSSVFTELLRGADPGTRSLCSIVVFLLNISTYWGSVENGSKDGNCVKLVYSPVLKII